MADLPSRLQGSCPQPPFQQSCRSPTSLRRIAPAPWSAAQSAAPAAASQARPGAAAPPLRGAGALHRIHMHASGVNGCASSGPWLAWELGLLSWCGSAPCHRSVMCMLMLVHAWCMKHGAELAFLCEPRSFLRLSTLLLELLLRLFLLLSRGLGRHGPCCYAAELLIMVRSCLRN